MGSMSDEENFTNRVGGDNQITGLNFRENDKQNANSSGGQHRMQGHGHGVS
jgi:hypothetical protein